MTVGPLTQLGIGVLADLLARQLGREPTDEEVSQLQVSLAGEPDDPDPLREECELDALCGELDLMED